MEMHVALWTFIFFNLSALTYNVPIKSKDVLKIPLNNATIHSAATAVVEFMIGNERTSVCHLQLKGSCKSVSDGCVCYYTPNFDALVSISYNKGDEFHSYRVITVDNDNKKIEGDWIYFADVNSCDQRNWGVGCLQTCDYRCHDNQCDHIDGNCTNGCRPGFKEPSCTKECERGTYGSNCTGICPSNCRDGYCDIVTGKCHHCQCGYTGDVCDQACQSGKYGKDCQHICSNECLNDLCYNMNGFCINCPAAKKDDQCDEVISNDENTRKVVTETDYQMWFKIVLSIAFIEFIVILTLIFIGCWLKRRAGEPTSDNKQINLALAETLKKDAPEDFNKKFYKGLKADSESDNDSDNLDRIDEERITEPIPFTNTMGAKMRADIEVHKTE